MTACAARPQIQVRKPVFDFNDRIAEFWFDNDPLRTSMLMALSAGFPDGERFFIESVRRYQTQITDPVLQQEVRSFIGQEAHHAQAHHDLNAFFTQRGYPIDKIEVAIGRLLNFFRRNLSPERQLAHTVAVEHFTALLSECYMLDPAVLNTMDPAMAQIWAWHAAEEYEHKSVAFDVYRSTVNNEWLRLSQMGVFTVLFLTFTSLDTVRVLRRTGRAGDMKLWFKNINLMWGAPGVFRKMIPSYLDYFRRDFHPTQHNFDAKLVVIKQQFLADL
jgi:predicted metal-dependent hydrolase